MPQTSSSKTRRREKTDRHPLYVKIGKRMRQARLMAKETNSRELSLQLGWSGGRINNFETGLSTPGVEETLQFCKAVGADPCWITYGVGSPRAASVQSTRYRNFMAVLEEAEGEGDLPELLAVLRLTIDRLDKFRGNPFKKIPDVVARRCEKHLNQRRGWLDETRVDSGYCEPLPQDMRELLTVYTKLSETDRKKLYEMSRVLLGEED